MNNKTRLINRAAVRDFALACLPRIRPGLVGKLTRVSGKFYERAQAGLTLWIEGEIAAHPSRSKTIS
jgi:hypothetical protein